MTQTFWLLPPIDSKDKSRRQDRTKERVYNGGRKKYDHRAMLQARIEGLSWAEVASRFGIKQVGRRKPAEVARNVLSNSKLVKSLSPEEATKLGGIL